jgi:hypothetical protein
MEKVTSVLYTIAFIVILGLFGMEVWDDFHPKQPEFTYMEWVTIKRGFYADTEGQILAQCTGGYLVLFMGEISSCIPTKFIKATEITDGNG